MAKKVVSIYTDGACSGNPGPGGWGAIILFGEVEKELSGFETDTTNNRMELSAVINALKALKQPCEVEVFSDSAYVINAFEKNWIQGWKQNAWRNASGDDIKNPDLWADLLELTQIHEVKWNKVKGHSSNEYNNRCDKLAVDAYKNAVKPDMQTELRDIDLADFEEKTLESEVVYEGCFYNIEKIKIMRPDGKEGVRDVLRHSGAAAIIPIDTDGGIFMVRQYRKAVDQVLLEIPAGKLDKGEEPLTCAIRELHEETGLKAGSMKHLFSLHPSPAIADEIIHIFVATDLTKEEQHTDDGEFVTVEKLPINVLIKYILNGEITDSKTISSILMAEKYLKGGVFDEKSNNNSAG